MESYLADIDAEEAELQALIVNNGDPTEIQRRKTYIANMRGWYEHWFWSQENKQHFLQ